MTYPPVLSLSAVEAVARARRIAALSKSLYILGTGGRNPGAETPFTIKKGLLGSDCIGFVLWCLGLDRYQPIDGKDIEYPFYDGWINTDSMLMDVHGSQIEFRSVYDVDAQPGDMVVYPSLWKDGKMIRMGHIGLIVEVGKNRAECNSHSEFMKALVVIDCAAALTRKIKGRAVAERNGSLWDKPDARIVRWKRQAKNDGYLDIRDLREIGPGELEHVMTSPKLGDRILKLNNPLMRGEDVKELQRLLKIQPDGWYGSVTSGTVKAFQLRNKLTSDGIVGPKTVAKLREVAG